MRGHYSFMVFLMFAIGLQDIYCQKQEVSIFILNNYTLCHY